jgi:ribose 5-phosphate isomerase B
LIENLWQTKLKERSESGKSMRVAIGADHGGFTLKEALLQGLRDDGYELLDAGTHSPEPVDYPDYARAVAEAVSREEAERGVIVCGSGVGASIVANKFPGIRAGLCHDNYSAHQGVEHDDMNVLCLGARVIGQELALELARAFLAARFSGEDRHRRRLAKVQEIERQYTLRSD